MDRAQVVITAGKAYRGLAAGFWDRDSDRAQALSLWEWFRAAERTYCPPVWGLQAASFT
jgi:hypothetical protein